MNWEFEIHYFEDDGDFEEVDMEIFTFECDDEADAYSIVDNHAYYQAENLRHDLGIDVEYDFYPLE